MELEAIRKFVQDHPEGTLIRMIDGTRYEIPHRDYISFGPPKEMLSGKKVVAGTSFIVFEGGGVATMKLVNAMLVAEVQPMGANGNGHGQGQKSKKKR